MTAQARNAGMAPDFHLLRHIAMNRPALERRATSLGGRRSVKKDWQVAWLLKAISLIDLTSLSGDDTPGRIDRLCAKARRPVRGDVLSRLGVDFAVTPGAVCVYHQFVARAVEKLAGSGIPVAAVSAGFPAGLSPRQTRMAEIAASVAAGAREIDIVIERHHVLCGNWQALYDHVAQARALCDAAHLKVILATGELGSLRAVARASMVAMMAGADFIKTSTGKEAVNATLPVALCMVRMIRAYEKLSGFKVGFKPAGGISDAKTALLFLILMKEELGNDWLQPRLFRIGASSLLSDIERQLEHCANGRYAARAFQPVV